MGWISSGSGINFTNSHWYGTFSTTSPYRLSVNKTISGNILTTLKYTQNQPYPFKTGKTYQFITSIWGYMQSGNATAASFSVSTPGWDEVLNYNQSTGATQGILNTTTPAAHTSSNLYFYASPPADVATNEIIEYEANNRFGFSSFPDAEGIVTFKMAEMNYFIQGFSYWKYSLAPYAPYNPSINAGGPRNTLGWTYDSNYDGVELFHWYDHSLVGYYPVGGGRVNKISSFGYKQNNYIAKFIPYSFFNLYFNYQNEGNFPLEMYMSDVLPTNNPGSFSRPTNSQLLCTLTQSFSGTYSSNQFSIPHAFYSIQGGRFLIIKGPTIGTQSSGFTYSNIFITNLLTDGGYHPGNNQQYTMTNTSQYFNPTPLVAIGLTGAAYSTFVGGGNTVNATSSLFVNSLNANIGNGLFRAGIWENGVWNSGWRYDDGVYEFSNISIFFNFRESKRWRVQIQGSEESVSAFRIGDKVSIGNIVAIDINEERKVLRNYFTIINKAQDSIVVEFDNDFPLRRIEKDSNSHRIYVTRNVWLAGAFFNGYFRGVWNYGLFKGYPLITEMVNSHWIDGIFDGGHFEASYYTIPKFVDTLFYPLDKGGKVGLTFSSKHTLYVGDNILIDKDNKSINPQYDTIATIDRVINDYHVVTDIDWGSDSVLEGGTVSVTVSKGLVQKMDFRSKNKSRITSNQSLDTESVFQYSSWMDVNYDNTSAVNIGKPTTNLNRLSGREYSENNLYGYPTFDILESVSSFRDSYSTNNRIYNLGSKYKIFENYIGDSGQFQEKFGPTGIGESIFLSLGWTYSRYNPSSLTFSRTEDNGDDQIIGEELSVEVLASGGILDVYPLNNDEVVGRTNQLIRKNRYTVIEFDLITYSTVFTPGIFLDTSIPSLTSQQKSSLFPKGSSKGVVGVPSIHFNNLNRIQRNVYYSTLGLTAATLSDATFLPIYQNVNHVLTPSRKKIEYFFNKRNLSMHFQANDYYFGAINIPTKYIIDNLKFLETDMIPFFKYFEESNISKGVEIPYQGVSPFIDYSDANFNFIDNISIGVDSIPITESTTPLGGVAPGITSNIGPGASSGGGGTILFDRVDIRDFGDLILGG